MSIAASVAPLAVTFAGVEVTHWLVGIVVLGLFAVMMGALLAFGAGRDHT